MEQYTEKAMHKAKFIYYAIFVMAVILAVLGYLLNLHFKIEIPVYIQTILSSISYLYLCISIPLALWLFNKKISAFTEIKEVSNRYTLYIKLVKMRLTLIAITFLANIVLFYLCHTNSFLYASAIGAVAMLFCKPNKTTIDRELNPIVEEE